jgi:K+-sensing histidine kinase KdpD
MMTGGDERAVTIVEETDRLNRIVGDLLDPSRLNSGGVQVQLELNPLDDLVSAAIRQTSGVLGARVLSARLPDGDILVGRFDSNTRAAREAAEPSFSDFPRLS